MPANQLTSGTTRRARPRGYWRWPAIILGLLGGHIAIMVAAVVLASSGRSFVVIPDYYNRAVRWDAEQAELRAGARLGWRCTITPSDQVDPLGRRTVAITLLDADGHGVTGADLRVAYFHHARAADRAQATARTDDRGGAEPILSMRAGGFWEITVTATLGGQKFVHTATPYVLAPATQTGGRK